MKDLLTVLAIVAAIIYCIAVAVVPVHDFKDCCYCGIPVEIIPLAALPFIVRLSRSHISLGSPCVPWEYG